MTAALSPAALSPLRAAAAAAASCGGGERCWRAASGGRASQRALNRLRRPALDNDDEVGVAGARRGDYLALAPAQAQDGQVGLRAWRRFLRAVWDAAAGRGQQRRGAGSSNSGGGGGGSSARDARAG